MEQLQGLEKHYRSADKVMLAIVAGLFVYSLVLANWYGTWVEAIVIGGLTLGAVTAISQLVGGSALSRAAMGAAFMVMSALHIHQAHGMIEIHFGIFVLLAVLLYYRDWLPIVTAAGVIAVHHLSFYYLQTNNAEIWVLSSTDNGWWVIFMHAGYVVVESSILVWMSINLKKEAIQSLEIMDLTDQIIRDDTIDLTLRSSGSTSLLCRFDEYTAQVGMLAQKVSETSGQLNRNGTNLAGVTDELKTLSCAQQKETDLIATAVEQMSAAIQEVSRNAEEAATSANEIDTSAQEATGVSQKTQQSVQQLADEVDQASRTMAELNEQSNRIGSVLDVIRGIAEQTNLLALNAAIEAARAGEQGRGFAVVADEVRTLAQRTQESTEEINQMIERLQGGSKSAVDAIETSRSHADRCVKNTAESLALMEQVSSSIEAVNKMNAMIATASSEQISVVDEISRNVNNILEASNKAAEDSSHASESGEQLLLISSDLDVLAGKFKVQ